MDSFFARFKNPLVLIAIVLLQIIALAMQVQRPTPGFDISGTEESSKVTLLRRWTLAVVTPFERVSTATRLHLGGLWTSYLDLRHVRQQDAALHSEIARLRQEQAAFAEDAAQGRRLQALLDFKQKYIATTVAAQVIGTSGTDRSRVVYLDKGYLDGLRPEQPVITPDGVVGKLRDVFPHTAQVLLLNDATSGAGVILSSARIRGILRGTNSGQVQINNLTADSRIKPGEQVITSGGDLVFPRGIPVGTIRKIEPDPQHQPYTAITIQPAADLSRLEEVLVITGTQSTLPEAAQRDASLAESTAQLNAQAQLAAQAAAQAQAREQQRAADLLADKLPSLHDDSTDPNAPKDPNATPAASNADTIGGLPGIPNSGLPRTRQALHPDRYSPGSTPPADSLQPGAAHPAYTPPAKPKPTPTTTTDPTPNP